MSSKQPHVPSEYKLCSNTQFLLATRKNFLRNDPQKPLNLKDMLRKSIASNIWAAAFEKMTQKKEDCFFSNVYFAPMKFL